MNAKTLERWYRMVRFTVVRWDPQLHPIGVAGPDRRRPSPSVTRLAPFRTLRGLVGYEGDVLPIAPGAGTVSGAHLEDVLTFEMGADSTDRRHAEAGGSNRAGIPPDRLNVGLYDLDINGSGPRWRGDWSSETYRDD